MTGVYGGRIVVAHYVTWQDAKWRWEGVVERNVVARWRLTWGNLSPLGEMKDGTWGEMMNWRQFGTPWQKEEFWPLENQNGRNERWR